jgi:hypothetical protein
VHARIARVAGRVAAAVALVSVGSVSAFACDCKLPGVRALPPDGGVAPRNVVIHLTSQARSGVPELYHKTPEGSEPVPTRFLRADGVLVAHWELRPQELLEAGGYEVRWRLKASERSSDGSLYFSVADVEDQDAPVSNPWGGVKETRWLVRDGGCGAKVGPGALELTFLDPDRPPGLDEYIRVEVEGRLAALLPPSARSILIGPHLCTTTPRVILEPGKVVHITVRLVDVGGNLGPAQEISVLLPPAPEPLPTPAWRRPDERR